MSIEGVPRFTDDEMRQRHANAKDIAQRNDVDVVLVFGHSGSRRHSQADIHYLTQVAPFHEAYCMLPIEGEPVLWTTHHNHFASAKENAWIPDVRRGSRDAASVVAAELRSRGFGAARIGVVGPVFYQEMDRIRAALPDASWCDLGFAFKMMRLKKSSEELAWQRLAAAGCDRVMAAVRAAIRPGVEERELMVISEAVAWEHGCQPNFLYLNSTSMAQSDSCVPNQNMSRRKLRMGDVINTELTVSYGMYSAQLLRPFFLGEPTPAYARLYEVLKSCHDRMAATMKIGTTLEEIREVSLAMREAGYTTVDGLLHGFGVDILPPTLSGDFAPAVRPYALEAGVTIVLQPNPATADERMGMHLGEMGVITANGFESMHASPAEVTICG